MKTRFVLVALIGGISCVHIMLAAPAGTVAVKQGYHAFACKLCAQTLAAGTIKNGMVSPASIAVALALLWNGAGGETRAAIGRALGVTGMAADTVNQVNAAWIKMLNGSHANVALTMANSLWVRQDAPVAPAFLALARTKYAAEVANVDFLAPCTVARINDWVRQHTASRITDVVNQKSFDAGTLLALVNAVYFKGKWATPFDATLTKMRMFRGLNGTNTKVPMMRQRGSFVYGAARDFQTVQLPYGDGALVMLVVLPATNSSVAALLHEASNPSSTLWTIDMPVMDGTVYLPRFTTSHTLDLGDALTKLGMGVAFTTDADFCALLISSNALLSTACHKTWIDVNEEGTEAAAVTAFVAITNSVVIPPHPFVMKVDRPFFYAIRERASGRVLFMGTQVSF